MNEFINMEVRFFLNSALWGVLLLAVYDCLRIFRKVINHGVVWISIEDIFYWMVSGVIIFRMMYEMNNGIIRGFSLIGILLGMILYKYSISEIVVKWISFLLIKIKRFLSNLLHILIKPLKFLLAKLHKLILQLWTQLKKRVGIIAHFAQIKAHTVWKALQTQKKRGRMKKKQQPIEIQKRSRRWRRKEARAS